MGKTMMGTALAAVALGAALGQGGAVAAAQSGCEVAIKDQVMYEGSLGGAKMAFEVTSTAGCAGTVKYRTVDTKGGEGWATAPEDYAATAGGLQLSGAGSQLVLVPIVPDHAAEPDELVRVELYEPSGATITRQVATGTILDDEGVTLGLDGGKIYYDEEAVLIPVDISAAPEAPVTVEYRVFDGTARDGVHYTAVRGVLTIPAGATTAHITVPLLDGAVRDPGAYFNVELSAPSAGTLSTPRLQVTVKPTP